MAKEYDFSGAERGKFYRPEAKFQIPVYLESDSLAFVAPLAEQEKPAASSVEPSGPPAERRSTSQTITPPPNFPIHRVHPLNNPPSGIYSSATQSHVFTW
jgi:hypothetical protein